MSSSQEKLHTEIISRSVADDWLSARAEWGLDHIYFADNDDPETCLCGQFPILEVCVIKNRKNGKVAEVCNKCVNNFMGIGTNQIFASVKRVLLDSEKSLNFDLILLAHKQRFIDDYELEFYREKFSKRKLSGKQARFKREINEKILARLKRAR